jgi:hypothetical protein
VLLSWGLAAVVLSFQPRWRASITACLLAVALMAWPVARADFGRFEQGLFSAEVPFRKLEREWIAYGKVLREVSRPGARIALFPAGAIVYFSQRGGVDLLGKVDPYVANLPVSTRRPNGNVCWRSAPGHNKEDDAGVFALRLPEFSRYQTPRDFAHRYVKFCCREMRFFVLQGTAHGAEER